MEASVHLVTRRELSPDGRQASTADVLVDSRGYLKKLWNSQKKLLNLQNGEKQRSPRRITKDFEEDVKKASR